MRCAKALAGLVLLGVAVVEPAKAAQEKGRPPKCVEVAVPATAQLYLAAQPDGVGYGDFDQSPANSPVAITLRDLGKSQALTVSAVGLASAPDEALFDFGPDARPDIWWGSSKYGWVAGLYKSVRLALHGVFLNVRSLDVPPSYVSLAFDGFALCGGSPCYLQPTRLAPPLGFPFLIGDGVTPEGATQVYRVAPNADTLYLGLVNSWVYSNTGGFSVRVCTAAW